MSRSSEVCLVVLRRSLSYIFFFFQAEDGIRDVAVTGVQTCALPISRALSPSTFSWWSRRSRPCSCPSTPNSPATRSCLRSGLLVTSSLTVRSQPTKKFSAKRSEEHTSELQSRLHLVCRLLLEKKKKTI